MQVRVVLVLILSVILFDPAHRIQAANGLNVIAVGFEANAMGGADTAVARDPFALNSNPAGLAQLRGLRVEQHGMIARALGVSHADAFNAPRDVSNQWIGVGNLGVSYALRDKPVVIGATLAAQGGVGVIFKNLATAFGTRDELRSMVRIAKGTFGAAWRVDNRLSLGVGLTVFYADAEQKLFPETSTPTFFGMEIKDARTLSAGFKAGALYRMGGGVALGAAYTSRSDLRFSGDHLVANMSAIGLGKVTYHNVTLTGLNQPQQIDLGLSWQATNRLLWSVKGSWVNWSSAVKSSTLTATAPDNPAAPAVLSNTATLGWRDQHVLALGAAFDLDVRTKLYAGLNLATNPVPAEHSSPLLGGWARTHVTGGFKRKIDARWLGASWEMGLGFEFLPSQHVTYTNAELPFVPNSRDNNGYIAALVGTSAHW